MKKILILLFLSAPVLLSAFQTNDQTVLPTDTLYSAQLKGHNINLSDSTQSGLPERKGEITGYFYKVLWITFILLVFLVAGLYTYKKFVLNNRNFTNNRIRVLGRQNISPKQTLLIVNIEGKKYALGSTDHSINLIAELGEATGDELLTNINPIGFGHLLKKISTKQ